MTGFDSPHSAAPASGQASAPYVEQLASLAIGFKRQARDSHGRFAGGGGSSGLMPMHPRTKADYEKVMVSGKLSVAKTFGGGKGVRARQGNTVHDFEKLSPKRGVKGWSHTGTSTYGRFTKPTGGTPGAFGNVMASSVGRKLDALVGGS